METAQIITNTSIVLGVKSHPNQVFLHLRLAISAIDYTSDKPLPQAKIPIVKTIPLRLLRFPNELMYVKVCTDSNHSI